MRRSSSSKRPWCDEGEMEEGYGSTVGAFVGRLLVGLGVGFRVPITAFIPEIITHTAQQR